MKILSQVVFPVIVMVAVTLLEYPLACKAKPMLPDCNKCREVDVGDDSHSLCSFGCSFYLKTTLPEDASDAVQRDIAHKILPILRLLRNFSPGMTENQFNTDIQFNHETLKFEPLTKPTPALALAPVVSEKGLIISELKPQFKPVALANFEIPELDPVYSTDSGAFEDSLYFPSSDPEFEVEIAVSESQSQSPKSQAPEADEFLESILMILPTSGVDQASEPLVSLASTEGQVVPSVKLDSWVPLVDTNREELRMPLVLTDMDKTRYNLNSNEESDDIKDLLFVPYPNDPKIIGTSDSDSASTHPTSPKEYSALNSADVSNNIDLEENEIPDEDVDEVTKTRRPAPRKASLLDMYYMEDSSLVKSKRVKKD